MPVITKPNQHFDVSTWTGDGSQTKSITGVNFQPDLVWNKIRSGTTQAIGSFDSVRGTTGQCLDTSATTAEGTWNGAASSDYGYVSSFDTNGFSMNDGAVATTGGYVNFSARTYVAWQWKAGGTTVSNTSGTLNSQVSANPTAGFSVVTYTGTGANATVGHGLGVAPSMVIVKTRSASGESWGIYHVGLTSAANAIYLNLTQAQESAATQWNSTAPTSSVFSVGTAARVNGSGATFVAYCWAAVAGYSAFGNFVGNGTQGAGPFVYTGFRPRYVLIKNINGAYDWHCFDTARGQFNYSGSNILKPNASDAELTARNDVQIDFLSNGFRLIGNDIGINQSTSTHIYAAFASAPFKYANAF